MCSLDLSCFLFWSSSCVAGGTYLILITVSVQYRKRTVAAACSNFICTAQSFVCLYLLWTVGWDPASVSLSPVFTVDIPHKSLANWILSAWWKCWLFPKLGALQEAVCGLHEVTGCHEETGINKGSLRLISQLLCWSFTVNESTKTWNDLWLWSLSFTGLALQLSFYSLWSVRLVPDV